MKKVAHSFHLPVGTFLNMMVIIWYVFLFSGCSKNAIFEKNYSFENGTWNRTEKPSFEVPVADTIDPVNFLINIRHNNDYPYSNLFLFVNTQYPDGNETRDTIEFVMARPDGEWLGKGFGKLKSLTVLLQPHLVFPKKGNYVFTFEQAMRVDELEGIEDFGISIEKMQENK